MRLSQPYTATASLSIAVERWRKRKVKGGTELDIVKIDELNDIAEGVLAIPMKLHLDREKVIRQTVEALRELEKMKGPLK